MDGSAIDPDDESEFAATVISEIRRHWIEPELARRGTVALAQRGAARAAAHGGIGDLSGAE